MSEQVAPVAEANGVTLYHLPWQKLVAVVPKCDALITDCPYSAKTHAGHDDGVVNLNVRTRGSDYRAAVGTPTGGTGPRRAISYGAWTADDVRAFVDAWHPICDGWMVSITDHILAPEWVAAFEAVGRYAFAPLPYVAPGSRVRLSGDGPSTWTCWIVVARPRTVEFSRWGTLPGAYILPRGMSEELPVVGGKPSWLCHRLAEHYSRPGDLVVDPCCGAGSLGIGAIRSGRRAILGDLKREHVDIAARWIRSPYGPPPGAPDDGAMLAGQTSIFGHGGGDQ